MQCFFAMANVSSTGETTALNLQAVCLAAQFSFVLVEGCPASGQTISKLSVVNLAQAELDTQVLLRLFLLEDLDVIASHG